MGVSSEQSEGSLNVDLNLVPFIDLLSSLVLFLLVTAVWMQVGTIPASVESKGQSRVSLTEQNRLTIRLTKSSFQISWPNALKGKLPSGLPLDFNKLHHTLDTAFKSAAKATVGVAADDGVEYGRVVEAIDVAKKAGFSTVALSTE